MEVKIQKKATFWIMTRSRQLVVIEIGTFRNNDKESECVVLSLRDSSKRDQYLITDQKRDQFATGNSVFNCLY